MSTLIGRIFGDQNQGTQSLDATARQQEAADKDDRYRQHGFNRATKHDGEPEALQKELSAFVNNRVFPEYEPSSPEKHRLQNEVANHDAQIQEAEEENEVLGDDIAERKRKTQEAKEEIEQLRSDGSYETKIDPVFWILAVLWGGIALLMLLFYPAATYTAMFSNFAADVQQTIAAGGDVLTVVTRSVFDPQAFAKAWQEDMGTFLLITLMPLVFLASGALLHRVLREYGGRRRMLWAIALIGGVFLLDFVLAYRITSMVYEVRFLAGLEDTSWKPWFIIKDIHFYLVLICGFVPHLIWAALSVVLHDMWIDGDPIRRREAQIERWRKANENDEERIRANKESIRGWRSAIRQMERKMEGDIIPVSTVEGAVEAFISGWNGFISASGQRVEERTTEVNATSEAYLDDLQARLGVDDTNDTNE
jgi:hypothetical protein